MSGALQRGQPQPRPRGRRSAIVLLVAAAALLVWALTAGDDPALRTAAVGGVVALTVAGIAIRYAHRAVREQRAAAEPAAPAPAADAPALPDSYQQLLHQLDAALHSPSYLQTVLVPRLEELLEEKQRGSAAKRVHAELRSLAAAAAAPRWNRAWLLRNRRLTAPALAAAVRRLTRLP